MWEDFCVKRSALREGQCKPWSNCSLSLHFLTVHQQTWLGQCPEGSRDTRGSLQLLEKGRLTWYICYFSHYCSNCLKKSNLRVSLAPGLKGYRP